MHTTIDFFFLCSFFLSFGRVPIPTPTPNPNTSYLVISLFVPCHSHIPWIYISMKKNVWLQHVYTHAVQTINTPTFLSFHAAVCEWTGKRGAVKDKGQHFTNCWSVWEEERRGQNDRLRCFHRVSLQDGWSSVQKPSRHPHTLRCICVLYICMHVHVHYLDLPLNC